MTGASGLLGSNAAFLAAKNGSSVTGLYHRNPVVIPGVQLHSLNLTDGAQVHSFATTLKPRAIIHIAANTSIDLCEVNHQLAHEENVTATMNLAQAAASLNIPFVFLSTDAFFDEAGHKFDEQATPVPLNYYGQTKVDAEDHIRNICKRHIIVRTNFYGWNLRPKHSFSEWIQHRVLQGQNVPLFQDVTFTPVFVNTLAEIIFELMHMDFTGTIHVAGSDAVTKLQFGLDLCKAFDLPTEKIQAINVAEAKLQGRRSHAMALNTSKLQKLLPHYDLSLESGFTHLKQVLLSGYVQTLKGQHWSGSVAEALFKKMS